MKTAEVLKTLMKSKSLSARQLARDTKLSQSTISDILAGRQATVKSLQVLAKHFDCSIDFLVNGINGNFTSLDNFEFETIFNDIVRVKIERLKK